MSQRKARRHVLYDAVTFGASAITAGTEVSLFGNYVASDGYKVTNLEQANQLPRGYAFDLYGLSIIHTPSMTFSELVSLLDSEPEIEIKINDDVIFRDHLVAIKEDGALQAAVAYDSDSTDGDHSNANFLPGVINLTHPNGQPRRIDESVIFKGKLIYNLAISASAFAATDRLWVRLHGVLYYPV